MDFNDLYTKAKPKTSISTCGGIIGKDEAPHMREVFIHINGWCRIRLKPNGTYTLDIAGQNI